MKIVHPFICCLLVISSCQQVKESANSSELFAVQQTESENITSIKNLFQSFNDKDINTFKDLSDPDYQYFFPSNNNVPQSREEMLQQLESSFSSSSKISYEIKDISASGNKVFVSYSFSGIHDDDLFDIPSTGNEFEVSSMVIFSMEQGRIVEVREESDVIGLMYQLDMEVMPKAK